MGQNMGQSLTHVLTHNRIAYNGQVSIFQNTMSAKSKKPRNFQNFLKRKSYDLRVSHSMFKTSPMPIAGTGRGFFICGTPTIALDKDDLCIEYGF
jgi:hypothetical protein